MDDSLAPLNGKTYDVVVIGGGINGTSAAQLLAADGYSVLLVDKGDFGFGKTASFLAAEHDGANRLTIFDKRRRQPRQQALLFNQTNDDVIPRQVEVGLRQILDL